MRNALECKISKNYEFEAKFLEKLAVEAPWENIDIASRPKHGRWWSWRSEKECAPVTPLYERDTIVIQKRNAKEKLTTGIQTKINVFEILKERRIMSKLIGFLF